MSVTPHVSHFYARPVVEVNELDEGYEIVLEGGPKIIDPRPSTDVPEVLVGKVFTSASYSASRTELYFGDDDNPRSSMLPLDPMNYFVTYPEYNDGALVPGQVPEEEPLELIAPEDVPTDEAPEEDGDDSILADIEEHRAMTDAEPDE
jgi:hypothetical protein